MAEAEQNQQKDDRKNFFIGLGAVAVVAISFGLCSSGSGSFQGSITSFTPIDEANLRVNLTITNDGDDSGKGECTVEAQDAGGFVVGFDILSSREDISPGSTFHGTGVLRIEDEGAFRVTDVVAKDCGPA